MTDPLIDDLKTLLGKEKGDERILKQIYRACENNEVISNYERNYVRKLAEKYLGRIAEAEEKQYNEEKSISDKISSDNQPKQNIEPLQAIQTQTIQLKPKNSKLLLGLGISIFAVVVIIGISLSGVSNMDFNDSQIPVESSTLSIQTDLSTYQKGDIISISGTSSTTGKINLSIENQDGQLVWSEQIFVKNNGKFSTLAIAGGNGWDESGTFTIKVENPQETTSSNEMGSWGLSNGAVPPLRFFQRKGAAMKKGMITACILLMGLSLYGVIESSRLERTMQMGVGIAFFPLSISIVIGGLAVLLLAGILKGRIQVKDKPIFGEVGFPRVVTVFGLLVGYLLLIEGIGYTVSTFLFFTAMVFFLQRGQALKTLLTSAACTFFLYAIFRLWLKSPLPTGLLGFRKGTRACSNT